MILINLLPHREVRREARKKDFFTKLVLAAILGAGLVFLGHSIISGYLSNQAERNSLLKTENAKLDAQIKEIANLKTEIDLLKARQKAVEDLQSDRNLPVYLFEELVKYSPEGVYLKTAKQDGLKVTINGVALTQERVSEFLRNVNNSTQWLERPELQEIKLMQITQSGRSASNADKFFDFTLVVMLKRVAKVDPNKKPENVSRLPNVVNSGAPSAPAKP